MSTCGELGSDLHALIKEVAPTCVREFQLSAKPWEVEETRIRHDNSTPGAAIFSSYTSTERIQHTLPNCNDMAADGTGERRVSGNEFVESL